MIPHQDVGMDFPACLRAGPPKQLKKKLSIRSVDKNVFAPISAIEDVVKGPLIFHPQFPRHRVTILKPSSHVNKQ